MKFDFENQTIMIKYGQVLSKTGEEKGEEFSRLEELPVTADFNSVLLRIAF